MTIAVEIRFPLGRYHATPWDRHVNEGAIEWPPSPWRLTRALFAVWKERCPDLAEPDVYAALDVISDPPSYRIPRWRSSATRHYYPPNSYLPAKPKANPPQKIVDAFVAVDPDDPLTMVWPAAPPPDSVLATLGTLLTALPFLGRADSVCDATLVEVLGGAPSHALLEPDDDGELRIAVPVKPLDLESLTITTDAMRKARFRQPLGMTHVSYPEPVPDDQTASLHKPRRAVSSEVNAFVFSVAGRPSPSHILTVAVAETFFRSAQSRFQKLAGRTPPPVLSGHPASGDRPREDQHQHAHVFALPDPSGSGKIGQLVVWASEGFGPTETAVLGQINTLQWSKGRAAEADRAGSVVRGFGPTRIQLVQLGGVETVAPQLAGPATRWSSITPFVPNRHQTARRFSGDTEGPYFVDFLTHEVERELAYRGIDAKVVGSVRPLPATERSTPAQRYRRYRLKQGIAGARAGVWLEFELTEAVTGPIALGALSHFGLGLFGPR